MTLTIPDHMQHAIETELASLPIVPFGRITVELTFNMQNSTIASFDMELRRRKSLRGKS